MAATPEQDITQAQVLGAVEPYPVQHITQGQVIAVYNYPSQDQLISQAQVIAPVTAALTMKIQQAQVIAVVKGRVEDRKLRAWAFSMDGHDFYVLRLGEHSTIVYDMTTGQWSKWQSEYSPAWRAHVGQNWLGMGPVSLGKGATSSIVAGDDSLGILWFVVPEQGYDDHPTTENERVVFSRRATGGLPMRMRTTQKCSGIYLTASLGNPQYELTGGADIILETSDDYGETFVNHGTITITQDDFTQEISWRSLGLISAPGRVFRVTDKGASVRIDGMDMWEDNKAG